jgi:hypothetical protein
LGIAAFLVVLVELLSGFYAMFTRFEAYDDEGYWLIAIRSYHQHGGLYGRTYSQCGPFYYEFWSGFFSLTRIPIVPNAARAITLGVWILTAMLLGVGLWLLTRRFALALLGELAAFLILFPLVREPMEPAGLAYLLVAVMVIGVGLMARGQARRGLGVVGISAAALFATKINIGLLVLAAIVVALLICWPSSRATRIRKAASVGILLAVAPVLMMQLLHLQWVTEYLLLEWVALLPVIVFVASRDTKDAHLSPAAMMPGVLLGAALLIVVFAGVLLNGTTPSELLNGTVLSQRGLAGIFHIILPIHMVEVAFGLVVALAGASIAWWTRSPERASTLTTPLSGVLRLAIGAWIVITAQPIYFIPLALGQVHPNNQKHGFSFLLAIALCFVALLRPAEVKAGRIGFIRLSLVLMGILGAMEAYPAAGSQFSWASFTLLPVAVVCLADGLEILGSTRTSDSKRSSTAFRASQLVPILLVALLIAAPLLATVPLKNTYESSIPLKSPAASWIHLEDNQANALNQTSAFLSQHCPRFFGLPGINTLYFLSGEESPTGLNTTQWMILLSAEQQQRIQRTLIKIPDLCVVVDKDALPAGFSKNVKEQTALVRYLEGNFRPISTKGPFVVLHRSPSPSRAG